MNLDKVLVVVHLVSKFLGLVVSSGEADPAPLRVFMGMFVKLAEKDVSTEPMKVEV